MSDFIAELEAELRAAASRRRPRRAPRVLLMAAAAAACAAVVIVGVRWASGLAPDEHVSGPPTPPACTVPADSPWLDRVPALSAPAGPAIPKAALKALPPIFTAIAASARRVASEDGIDFWVVPVTRRTEGERCAPPTLVCTVTVPASGAGCDGIFVGRVGDRIAVLGTSGIRDGSVSVAIQRGGGNVPVHDGVVAGLLRRGARMKDGEFGVAVRGPFPVVAVLNGTVKKGLATRTAARLKDGLRVQGFEAGMRIGNFTTQHLAASSVRYSPGTEEQARLVARILRITDVVPLDQDTRELAGGSVVVVLGRMR